MRRDRQQMLLAADIHTAVALVAVAVSRALFFFLKKT
jgi:hypothetical protein